MQVNFYDSVDDDLLKFAVIIAKADGKWVFCKHKERETYEIAGGHRESGESILDTAKRELNEETGARDFSIKPVCVYSVIGKNRVNQSLSGKKLFPYQSYRNTSSECSYHRCKVTTKSNWCIIHNYLNKINQYFCR